MTRSHTNRREVLPAVKEARRMFKAQKGPPTEADRPRRRSRPPKVLPGQMDIYEALDAGGSPEEVDDEYDDAA
jgi:hypothetical protein